MKWRKVDNMVVSACIQKIQQEINEGVRDASELMGSGTIPEDEAIELYNAWRIYFMDRMEEEYDKNNWEDTHESNPFAELEYDVQYCKKILADEKTRND